MKSHLMEKEKLMADTVIETPRRRKVLYYEVMCLLSILFVVYAHTQANGFFLFARYPVSDVRFWLYLALTVSHNFCVPLFFAISGALMLNKPDEPLKKLWLNRILRFGIVLVAVCFLYYFQSENYQLGEINPKTFLIVLYSYCSGGITWYLYAYVGYLITLPILRSFVQNLKDEHFYYLFAVALLFNGLIPVAEYLIFSGNQSLNPYLSVSWIACNTVLYPCLGYFLEHRFRMTNPRKTLGILWIANVAGLAVSCAMTAYVGKVTGVLQENDSEIFFTSFALISCATVYLTVKQVMKDRTVPGWLEKLLCSVGKCVFGIYLLHYFVMCTPAGEVLRQRILGVVREPMLASWVFCVTVILMCYGITLILKKIPFVNKLI